MPDDQKCRPAEPTPDVRSEIAALFARLLERDTVPHDVHFADLGGDSIQLLSLLLEIEERFAVPLTPPQFAEAGSVEALAALVQAEQPQNRLVVVQEGEGVPLFLAHGVTGVTPYAAALARLLGRRQRLVVMHWQAPPEGSVPALEVHAAPFAAAIRRAWPSGPYHIAGHSFGGLLAFEVARQISAAGGDVRFLGLMDSMPLLHERRFGVARAAPPAWRPEKICGQMLARYVPGGFRGDLWLFRAGTPAPADLFDPTAGWGDLVLGQVHQVEAGGTHSGMMAQAQMARWVPALRRALDEAGPPAPRAVPAPGVALGLEGLDAARRGDREAEIAACRAAIAAAPRAPYWVWRNLAAALAEAGDTDGACAALEASLRVEAVPIKACVDLFRLLRKRRPDEAARWAAEAHRHDDGSIAASLALADLDMRQGDLAAAERRYRLCLDRCPILERAARKLQVLLMRQGRIAEALVVAQRIAAEVPAEIGPMLDVASLAAQLGDEAARIAAARAVLARRPGHKEAARLLAGVPAG